MRFSKKILLLVFICSTNAFSFAQQIKNERDVAQYRAIHWGLEDGLSQGVVWDMIKDADGFMWIGTDNGLNRFDGFTFKKYFADITRKNKTITGNIIQGLVEDSLHNIWIGTNNGLSRYDIKADSFTNFTADIAGHMVIPFWSTIKELYCISDNHGFEISVYNTNTFQKKTLFKFSQAESDSAGNAVSLHNAVLDEKSGIVWMQKGDLRWPGGGLLQISLKTGVMQKFNWPCYKKIINHSHFSEGMRYDRKRNCIWINSPDGIVQFTLDDNHFHYADALNQVIASKGFGTSSGIDIDKSGRIWIGSNGNGIITYNPEDHSAQLLFENDPGMRLKISGGNVIIYCDKEGIAWLGCWVRAGIYQLLPSAHTVSRYTAESNKPGALSDDFVRNCINADSGTIWMTTTHGIEIFHPATNLFTKLALKFPCVNKGSLYAVKVDTLGKKAWILDYFNPALFEIDLQSGNCNKIIFEDSNSHILPIIAIWAETYKNSCIIKASYNHRVGIFTLKPNSIVAQLEFSFPDGDIGDFVTGGKDDNFLFLTHPNTANNFTYRNVNGKWIHTPNPLDSIQWGRITYNKIDSSYWISNVTRLLHYDKNFHFIQNYSEKDGLPEFEIYRIIVDNKNNIWFNTDRSIHQLNVKTGTVTTLSDKDGFQPQNFVTWARAAKDEYGHLYFPAGNWDGTGFDLINPDAYNSPTSSVYLQSLEINQKPYTLSTGVNNLQQLSLRYFENKITIETGTIDFYSKGKNHIRYKLEGSEIKNINWQYAPDYYTIRYEELPPGKYTLMIQASNASNEFNGPVKTLAINISPAFWNTWWFRILAVICIGLIFYGLIRWRLQQRFRIQLERSEKEKQIAELQQQKTEVEMQALRAQMNPHFIFNSLNSINRFILQNDRLQASEYLTKFSKLVRMILQNSQSPLIPLESELESLSLYLEMEALRFNYHFDYKISVPKDLDVEILKVPPLILQPYVENAIWHGLMHKEEKGQLNIDVSQEEDHLYFRIADNGIGRKKAAEIAGKSVTKHKSMGLRITANRIAMMQSSNGSESPVKIIDLVETDGTAAGTEVVIKLPVIEQE